MLDVMNAKQPSRKSSSRRARRQVPKPQAARAAPEPAAPGLRVDLKGFVPARRRRPSGRPPRDFSARREILRAASYVFVRKGVAETTVEDILDATGMGRATFYRAFRSKEDVFEALQQEFLEAVTATFHGAGAGVGRTPEKLEQLITAHVALAVETGDLFDLIALESLKRDTALEAAREAAADAITGIAHREQRLHGKKPADPLLIRAYIGAFDAVIRYMLRNGLRSPDDRARAVRTMLDVVRAVTQGVHTPAGPSALRPTPRKPTKAAAREPRRAARNRSSR
jgi:AcrR family transcriptional regulator